MDAPRDYTIVAQRQLRDYNSGRQLVDQYEISYAGPNGITGWVRIPVAEASANAVDALIRQQLTTQLDLQQLGARS